MNDTPDFLSELWNFEDWLRLLFYFFLVFFFENRRWLSFVVSFSNKLWISFGLKII